MASRTKDIQKVLEKELKKKISLKKMNKAQLQFVGDLVVEEVKIRVAKGQSPIEKGKRFPAYKDPKVYPAKQKRKRPVNLFLSGDFLNHLKARVRTGFRPRITIGFFDKKSILKEKGHREGAGGQPKRPIIPLKNESFSRQVKRNFLISIQKVLNKIF